MILPDTSCTCANANTNTYTHARIYTRRDIHTAVVRNCPSVSCRESTIFCSFFLSCRQTRHRFANGLPARCWRDRRTLQRIGSRFSIETRVLNQRFAVCVRISYLLDDRREEIVFYRTFIEQFHSIQFNDAGVREMRGRLKNIFWASSRHSPSTRFV